MQFRALITAIATVAITISQLAPPAAADNTKVVRGDRIRYVFEDSPETSNAPFPPNQDPAAVRSALREVIVRWGGRRIPLGQYLRSRGVRLSRVVTVKVQGESAAIYEYHDTKPAN